MATGRYDGDSPVNDSSESTDSCKMPCQPCYLVGQQLEAVGLCTDCQEYLCQDCFDGHTVPRPTRNHTLLSMDLMLKDQEQPSPSKNYKPVTKEQILQDEEQPSRKVVYSESCTVHEYEVIKYYCTSCCKLCCEVCIIIDHRSCDTPKYIHQVAKDLTNNEEYIETQKQLKTVTERSKRMTSEEFHNKTQEKNTESLENECAELVKMAKEFRKDMNVALDKLEAVFVKEIETVNSEDMGRLSTLLDKCKAVQTELNLLITKKETFEGKRQNCSMYALMMRSSVKIKRAEDHMKETDKELENLSCQINFVANKEMLDKMRHPGVLGTIKGTDKELANINNQINATTNKEKLDNVRHTSILETVSETKGAETKANSAGSEAEEDIFDFPHTYMWQSSRQDDEECQSQPLATEEASSVNVPAHCASDKNKEIQREGSDVIKSVKTDKYSDDQWSTLNRDGRRNYGRDFLLQLAAAANHKPEEMPDVMEIMATFDKVQYGRCYSPVRHQNQRSQDQWGGRERFLVSDTNRRTSSLSPCRTPRQSAAVESTFRSPRPPRRQDRPPRFKRQY